MKAKHIFCAAVALLSFAAIPPAFASESVSDYEAISRLVTWERQSRVRHLYDEMANCYFPDATVTTSWTRGPASAYLSNRNRLPEASEEGVILVRYSPPIVHQNNKRAYAELPITSNRWVKVNGEEAVLTSYMRLVYCVECREGVWKITDLTTINEDDTLAPAIPGTDLHIDPEELKGLRHSYRFLAYVRMKAGGKIRDDELGIDLPEAVEKVYQEFEEWIKGGEK